MFITKRLYVFIVVLIAGCQYKSAHQKLADYVNDPENKITQSIKVGNINTIAKWLPYAYRNPNADKAVMPKEEEDYCYFDVRFEKETTEKPVKEKMLYLNFDMQKDFTLLCKGDSIAPAICQKIENGISGNYQYLLVFECRWKDKKDFTLFYKDKIFGTGTIAFVYKDQDLKKIPML